MKYFIFNFGCVKHIYIYILVLHLGYVKLYGSQLPTTRPNQPQVDTATDIRHAQTGMHYSFKDRQKNNIIEPTEAYLYKHSPSLYQHLRHA